MGDERSKPPPLERRVPGATRAGPASPTRPELPEALLQRMQAVVKAAHAQAMQEEQAAARGATGSGRGLRGASVLAQARAGDGRSAETTERNARG